MEENENYKAINELVEHLQSQINSHKDQNTLRREIENQFERAIHALEKRRDVLLGQLEQFFDDKFQQNDYQKLQETLNTCQEIKKTGALCYKNSTTTAEHIWQGAKNLDIPRRTKNDVVVTMPTEFLDAIANYGAVSISISDTVLKDSDSEISAPVAPPSEPRHFLNTNYSMPLVDFTKPQMITTIVKVEKTMLSYFFNSNSLSTCICWNPKDSKFYFYSGANSAVYKLSLQGDLRFYTYSSNIRGMAFYHKNNTLFVTNTRARALYKIKKSRLCTVADFSSYHFEKDLDLCVDQQSGTIFVTVGLQICKVTQKGDLSFMALEASEMGSNAKKIEVRPHGICFDQASKTLIVCDTLSNRIWRVSLSGQVSTICPIEASLYVTLASNGTILVTASQNRICAVRQVAGEFRAEAIAGNGTDATIDGKPTESSFSRPFGIVVHEPSNSCFVTERESGCIRRIHF
eukprot:Phypoly_transcript_07392.p1 GENE.Phypoly_transcript_07392~~Phypoly_transcript_07392.p1  ORF type:complete len:461 (+),score=54.89 Phypoly_transcript_07392:163-1545(+)